jgi:hypothetical protein
MKNIIIISFFAGLFTSSFAQSTDMDKFRGTWQWVSGTDTLTIQLQKEAIQAPTGDYVDCIVGWHRYVKNGIQVESAMQHVGAAWATGKCTIIGGIDAPNQLYITSIEDLTIGKKFEVIFSLVSNTQAHWKSRDARGIYRGPHGTVNQFTMPRDIIFTKL